MWEKQTQGFDAQQSRGRIFQAIHVRGSNEPNDQTSVSSSTPSIGCLAQGQQPLTTSTGSTVPAHPAATRTLFHIVTRTLSAAVGNFVQHPKGLASLGLLHQPQGDQEDE